MKKIMTIIVLISLGSFFLNSCGGTKVDICKCLKTSASRHENPESRDWLDKNRDACDQAISKKIGSKPKTDLQPGSESEEKLRKLFKSCGVESPI